MIKKEDGSFFFYALIFAYKENDEEINSIYNEGNETKIYFGVS